MHRDAIPITTPCGADWTEMTPAEARARMCASCNKLVHDVSAMSPARVRRLLSNGPVCVRYLYDAHGRVLFGEAPAGARLVPAGALLSKRVLAAAALAGTALVFEACGGADGGSRADWGADAGRDTPGSAPTGSAHVPATPAVVDGGDGGDAETETDDGGADAGDDGR